MDPELERFLYGVAVGIGGGLLIGYGVYLFFDWLSQWLNEHYL